MVVGGVSYFIKLFGWVDSAPLAPVAFFEASTSFHCTNTVCYALLGVWFAFFSSSFFLLFFSRSQSVSLLMEKNPKKKKGRRTAQLGD
jgi:hypothetical protein